MQKIENLLMGKYEVEKNLSFFCMIDTVLSGVILRQHIFRILNGKTCSPLPRWVKLGLLKKRHFAHSTLYSMSQSIIFGRKWHVDITSSLVLRSAMRMEYFLSLGLDTPEKVMAYAEKGNNCSIRGGSPSAGLLGRYKAALEERGISIPDLAEAANVAALKRIMCREIYIDRLSLKGNILCPQLVYLNFRNDGTAKIARNIATVTEELQAIFCGRSIAPTVTICTFQGNDSGQGQQAGEIYKRVKLPAYWGREDWLSFKRLPNPFPYLPPQNLL